jgi:indolepyruvate ferredoxin oxidoreductase
MNAPLPESVQTALQRVTLDDKYALADGKAFMSGVQALVRLPMLQRVRDGLQGKNTAGFISGYRGSPLGGYDQALWAARKHLEAQHIVFQPGVNEELAATAVWGTQQLGFAPKAAQKYDGVFGIWYGKGPGVDRCSDVFKHANMAGTTPWGGALAIAGDDHVAKSSTAAHQSDHIFKACGLPVFFPANVQEILDLGLHAIAMSRFSGVWASMKTIQEIVESSATVDVGPDRLQIVLPDFPMPPGGVHIRWPDDALSQEARLFDHKWYAALAYIRANRLNHNVIAGPQDRLGLIASGKAYNDTRQALQDLGLTEAVCQAVGVRLHKVAVVWPLEALTTREFATGLQEILVIEEKRQVIEYQLKEELYNWRSDVRPTVLGKFDELPGDASGGEWSVPNPSANTLLRANADLNPAIIARAIAKRLLQLGVDEGVAARMQAHLALLDAKERSMAVLDVATQAGRTPWFCSGCPHNTSTKVPDGSRAMAGIGCHFMSVWMDRSTLGFTQMGGEGVPWVGQQPFTSEPHVFANLGDGTYFHSGLLAVRQSIAAGVNITYKLLYNGAVAMTGGQPLGERAEGHSVLQIANSLRAEGVRKITVVTDEPHKYEQAEHVLENGLVLRLPEGIEVLHRDRLDEVQRQMREVQGCTAIIYDQACATEKRRKRKRGTLAESETRVFIHPEVCEGCGDCGVQSNCLSVEPLETPLGRKRTINQNSCNKDISCVKGFCPSFITVRGGTLKKQKAQTQSATPDSLGELPDPVLPSLSAGWNMVVAGVGGTGVITIGQLLGMAAHLEGIGIVTQDAAGLAQKGGATWSHVLLATAQCDIATTRVSTAAADLILACDPIVGAQKETLLRMREGKTHVVLNAHSTPTASFVHNRDWASPADACVAQIAQTVGSEGVAAFDADTLARCLMGDTLYINPMVLGYAWQKGWLPLSKATLMRAMELNNVQVEANKRAFAWGRVAAAKPLELQRLLAPAVAVAMPRASSGSQDWSSTLQDRAKRLTQYQNAAYAKRYTDFVERVAAAQIRHGQTELAQVVAEQFYRLMAYKDEYEVARLHTQSTYLAELKSQFEGNIRWDYHLAPAILSGHAEAGSQKRPKKHRLAGAWMHPVMRLLAPLKFLRGTALDPFARNPERQQERAWITRYEHTLLAKIKTASPDDHAALIRLAQSVQDIRGFGPVKLASMAKVQALWEREAGN